MYIATPFRYRVPQGQKKSGAVELAETVCSESVAQLRRTYILYVKPENVGSDEKALE